MQPKLAIQTKDLTKVFGETRAVDGLNLNVPAGIVYGVLGPNGAGKTTAIRILSTLLRPDSGTAQVFGHDLKREARAVRGLVGLTGQFASVDEDLTGFQNLLLLGRLEGYARGAAQRRARDLLAAFGLADAGDRTASTYSGGMRRRLDIAASIIKTPKLIFLDEPTTGLDPRSRNQVWDIVRALVAQGTTVLLTTQYLDEADQLADRIAVIDHGKVIAEGTPGELKRSVGSGAVRIRLVHPEQRSDAERTLARVLRAQVHLGDEPSMLTANVLGAERVGMALQELTESGIEVADFTLGQPSLDEVFLALTGRPTEETLTAEENAA